jgi:AraC family transcriptional activator of pobA
VGLHRLHHQATQPPRPRRDLQLATELIEIVEKNFRHLRKMSDYASLLAISPQRLNAACQSALGCSASQILHDRLLTEARRLLAYTELTVAEVGHELGFDDPAYFNRFFANRAGHPPGAWRAAHSATLRADPERSVD